MGFTGFYKIGAAKNKCPGPLANYQKYSPGNNELSLTWLCIKIYKRHQSIFIQLYILYSFWTNINELFSGLLYICQGCWLECQSDSECLDRCKTNVVLLYQQGVFSSAVELLSIEME